MLSDLVLGISVAGRASLCLNVYMFLWPQLLFCCFMITNNNRMPCPQHGVVSSKRWLTGIGEEFIDFLSSPSIADTMLDRVYPLCKMLERHHKSSSAAALSSVRLNFGRLQLTASEHVFQRLELVCMCGSVLTSACNL